jgi:DNA polymerase-3 subunit epsilon
MLAMYHPNPDDRARAIEAAQLYMSRDPLFLDTETTGLSRMEEVCEIAIIDAAGQVLINTLIKPTKRIPFSSTDIHGISDEMVADAPTIADLLPSLESILRDRTVLVYNVEFDEEKLERSLVANGIALAGPGAFEPWWNPFEVALGGRATLWHCVMELYAVYYGDWHDYHQSYRWQGLSTALRQCEIALPAPPPQLHRAHADVEMTRRLMLYLAEDKPAVSPTFDLREG